MVYLTISYKVLIGLPWQLRQQRICLQCRSRDPCSIAGSGISPGEGNGNSLQYSCLEIHGQRTMAGCSSCGLQESETTKGLKHTSLNDHYHNMKEIYIKFVDRNFNTNKVFVLWSRVIEKLALFKIPHIRKNLKFYILKKQQYLYFSLLNNNLRKLSVVNFINYMLIKCFMYIIPKLEFFFFSHLFLLVGG